MAITVSTNINKDKYNILKNEMLLQVNYTDELDIDTSIRGNLLLWSVVLRPTILNSVVSINVVQKYSGRTRHRRIVYNETTAEMRLSVYRSEI